MRLRGVVQVTHDANAAVAPVRSFLFTLPAGCSLRRNFAVVMVVYMINQRNLNLVLAPLSTVMVIYILHVFLGRQRVLVEFDCHLLGALEGLHLSFVKL